MENARCSHRGPQLWVAVAAVIIWATRCRGQGIYVVGEGTKFQWDVPPYVGYYQDWANERDFSVNDTLSSCFISNQITDFQYNNTLHNVIQVETQTELVECVLDYNETTLGSSNEIAMEITISTNNTFYYFMSWFGNTGSDCEMGMKFWFYVGGNDHDGNITSQEPASPSPSPPPKAQIVVNESALPSTVLAIPWIPHSDSSWTTSVLPGNVGLNSFLVFNNYSRSDNYSVTVVQETDYDLCNSSNGKTLDFGASPILSQPGTYYFIDGNHSLCQNSNMNILYQMRIGRQVNGIDSILDWDSKLKNVNLFCLLSFVQFFVGGDMIEFCTYNDSAPPNGLGTATRRVVDLSVIVPVVTVSVLVVFTFSGFIIYRSRKQAALTRYKSEYDYSPAFETKDKKAKATHYKMPQDGTFKDQNGMKACKSFTLEELEMATSNFSEENEIGCGAFGAVYKGQLKDGQVVAVKRSIHQRTTDVEQFINEVSILSQVNHCNLVKLLGCCLNLNLKVPLLVYEFIPNGTLKEHLSKSEQGSSTNLDWPRRFDIAMQTADAIKYLHSQAKPPIVHRDVKTANILLDENFGAKVADFGLSKLFDVKATHISTAIKGTPGYLDPEYFYNSQLTEKSDVYSYGMVLLELITSKKPIDRTMEQMEQNLAVRMVPLIKCKSTRDIIDTQLLEGLSEEDFEKIQAVAEVAVACLAKERASRPSMTQVVEMLRNIRGSKLQADSFFRSDENTGQPRGSRLSEILRSIDSTKQSFDVEAGGSSMFSAS